MKPIIQEKISQVIKHIDFPQLQFLSKVVDMPVVGQQQASLVVEKTVEIPEIRTVWGTETYESLDTARTRQNDARQQHEQQHHNNQQQSTRQTMQQRTGEKERERRKRAEREKGRNKEVKKDVTGWTVVTRNTKGEEKDDSDLRQGERVWNISARCIKSSRSRARRTCLWYYMEER